jgi:hypothetical protein
VQEIENEMKLSKLQFVAGGAGLVLGVTASAYYLRGDADPLPVTEEVALTEERAEEDEALSGYEEMADEEQIGESVRGAEVLRPPGVKANDTRKPEGTPVLHERGLGDLQKGEGSGVPDATLKGTLAISLSGDCLLDQYFIEIGAHKFRRRSATMQLPAGSHEAVVSARVNMSSTRFRPTKRSRTVSFVIEPESEANLRVNLCKS